jgi:hypothetical protein
MSEQANLELSSREKVAFDLMGLISRLEKETNKDEWLKPDPRTYFLKLFNQCIKASYDNSNMGYIVNNE